MRKVNSVTDWSASLIGEAWLVSAGHRKSFRLTACRFILSTWLAALYALSPTVTLANSSISYSYSPQRLTATAKVDLVVVVPEIVAMTADPLAEKKAVTRGWSLISLGETTPEAQQDSGAFTAAPASSAPMNYIHNLPQHATMTVTQHTDTQGQDINIFSNP